MHFFDETFGTHGKKGCRVGANFLYSHTMAAAFHRSVIRAASRDLISKKHRLDLFPAPAAHSLGEQRNPLGSTAKESRGFSVWIYDLMLLGKSVVYSI
jgi:hypothetical protein